MMLRREPSDEARRTKELRLGLVCYGGVSLSIYMHGVTKEIHKLVVASHELERHPEQNPFPRKTTEHVYWALLKRLGEESKVRTRVVVDVIAGTSAGASTASISPRH